MPLEPPRHLADPTVDPWSEQRRRALVYRRARRRRRLRSPAVLATATVVAASLVAGVWWVATRSASGDAPATAGAPDRPASTELATPTTAGPVPGVAAEGIELEDVWLLDRGDGTFDWGVIVASVAETDRVSIDVTARVLDDAGDEVEVLRDEIGLLPAGARAAAGGVLVDPSGGPARIEAEASVGLSVAPSESSSGTVTARAIERREDVREGRGEVLTGRLDSTLPVDVDDVVVAALWRDDAGVVVGSVFVEIERVRPNVEARFEVPLDGRVVPAGPPDEVVVTR